MGHYVAIPSAALWLADWGADVLKIEPLSGDTQRAARDGQSYQQWGLGKERHGTIADNHTIQLDGDSLRCLAQHSWHH